MTIRRCGWSVGADPARADLAMLAYDDTEWGVLMHEDRRRLEFARKSRR